MTLSVGSGELDSLEAEVSSLKDTISSLGDSLQAEQLNVKELTSQLEESKNDVVKLTEENDATSQSNQDLQASLTELSGLKETLEASVAELETKLESVTNERDTAQSRVSELVSSINSGSSSGADGTSGGGGGPEMLTYVPTSVVFVVVCFSAVIGIAYLICQVSQQVLEEVREQDRAERQIDPPPPQQQQQQQQQGEQVPQENGPDFLQNLNKMRAERGAQPYFA
jgi:hypothetical protein